jgi:hypothetical protein
LAKHLYWRARYLDHEWHHASIQCQFANGAVAWNIVGSSDFNGDGKADILWQDNFSGQRVIWIMNGTTLQSWVDLGTVPTSWNIRNY